MSNYTIIENCRTDARLRSMFFDFTRTIYPNVDFVEWYTRGFWQDEYTPHVIVDNDLIVANVSATRMKLTVNDHEIRGVQIGTVGTVPEYRGRGLSRLLMEHIIDKYQDSSDLLFLFANSDVLDFYTKFGFVQYYASLFKTTSAVPPPAFSARQLSIHSRSDMTLLQSLLQDRTILTSRFGAIDYAFVTQWHILNIFSNDLFYVEKEDAVIIARERDESMHVYDVICRNPIDPVQSLAYVMKSPEARSIVWYFPPDQLHFDFDETPADDDCPQFVRGDFAVADGKFKFPTTAQT